MRCYFNLANTDEMTADQEGIEVLSLTHISLG